MKLIYSSIFIALLLVTGCGKTTPEACFTTTTTPNSYTTEEGYPEFSVNTNIQFDASCSKNGITYQWEFGDGSKATKKNKSATTSHTYSKAGKFVVKLTVKNKSKYKVALMVVVINP